MNIIEPKLSWAYGLTPRSITTHLILHHSASESATVEGIHSYHLSKGWAGMAYHYLVRKDGSIFRGRPETMLGGHTTNWNWCSIGICFEGNFETEEMSEAQKKAGRELIADIRARYPSIVVGRHSDFGQTACPGKNFPFEALLAEKAAEPCRADAEDEGVPDQWAAKACMWAASAGIFRGDDKADYRWHEPVSRQELAVLLKRYDEIRKN